MGTINYDKIPNRILFNLRELENLGLIKISMAKKIISNGKLEIVKIGNRIHVARSEIIRYLEANTIVAAS
ncbi:MAG: DNA-binding protein [Sulfurimonas sp.]|jgi:hypothetical protein